MARTESTKPNTRMLYALRVTSLLACAAGLAILLVALFDAKSPLITATPATLLSFGWAALAFGVVLLVFLVWQRQIKPAQNLAGESLDTAKASRRQRKAKIAGLVAAETPSPTSTPTPGAGAAVGTGDSSSRPAVWNAKVLDAIEWQRFEAVCEALFAQPGFEVQSQSHGAQGGVDIWLYSRSVEGSVAIVKCKRWHGKPVDVRELRKFLGEVASHQLKRGTYATTSTFTAAALQFAEANGVRALDGEELLKMITERSPEEQQALLREAFDGDYWRPTCASCGVKMVERTAANGGASFWGCSDYPRCKLRLPMVDNLRQLSLLVE